MQGIKIDDTILYHDNMSSILLEKNVWSSSSKQTRHMNIRFFFIKDQVESKEIRIEYCPTAEMVADFFPKHFKERNFTSCGIRWWTLIRIVNTIRTVLNQCNYEDVGTNAMTTVNQDGVLAMTNDSFFCFGTGWLVLKTLMEEFFDNPTRTMEKASRSTVFLQRRVKIGEDEVRYLSSTAFVVITYLPELERTLT